MYKLQKFTCHYNLRKYSFCSKVVNMWNSLPNEVVEVDIINIFKNRLVNTELTKRLFMILRLADWNWRSTNLYMNV